MSESQFLNKIETVISDAEIEYREGASVQVVNKIPDPGKIPQRGNHWKKIQDVISVFVDMKDSTKLSAEKHGKSTAEIYQFFTNTIVKILRQFEVSYVDVKGDGVFGIFNSNLPHTALAAAVTCKTFSENNFKSAVKNKRKISLGCHIGIDQKTVLVKKIGAEPRDGEDSHLRNEVWAGKPVNMSAKLAARADEGEVLVSDRFYSSLESKCALISCGCGSNVGPSPLWTEKDVSSDENFDFEKAHLLQSKWCSIHGKDYCQKLLDCEA